MVSSYLVARKARELTSRAAKFVDSAAFLTHLGTVFVFSEGKAVAKRDIWPTGGS